MIFQICNEKITSTRSSSILIMITFTTVIKDQKYRQFEFEREDKIVHDYCI